MVINFINYLSFTYKISISLIFVQAIHLNPTHLLNLKMDQHYQPLWEQTGEKTSLCWNATCTCCTIRHFVMLLL